MYINNNRNNIIKKKGISILLYEKSIPKIDINFTLIISNCSKGDFIFIFLLYFNLY